VALVALLYQLHMEKEAGWSHFWSSDEENEKNQYGNLHKKLGH